ncbi:MAG: O-methyltransferase [Anaerococcus sp.]|nr:O-methyltransferase [Anaerococcus sp.]
MGEINNNITYPYISSFIDEILLDLDFLDLRKFAMENKVPIMKSETKAFLVSLLAMKDPKNILEIGTAIGYSSLIFKTYSKARVTSIEVSKEMAAIARNNFKKYNKEVTLINEDAVKALSYLDQGFDFVFIDANKSSYKYYFEKTSKLLDKGGVIVCDNVLFRGEVANDDLVEKRKITIVKRLREFLAYLSQRKDFRTSIIPIGDGISLSIKER